jgi:Zn-dependent protease
LERFLLIAPVLLFSMVAHEYAHGRAALAQGDETAQQLGRLTFNPMKHIDPIMTIFMPIITFIGSGGTMAFGGAKPIPVQPDNFTHRVRGDIIVSLAGIAANIGIAILLVPLTIALWYLGRLLPDLNDSISILQVMFFNGIAVNLVLAAFNLFPIPPLDGSHVAKYLMPKSWAARYERVGAYGIVILLVLLNFGRPVFDAWMKPAMLLIDVAARFLAPYVIPSPWTSI